MEVPQPFRTSPTTLLLRLALALALALTGLLLAAPAGGAAEIRNDETVRVAEGEVVDDDLYAAAGEVVVDGTVRGDLVVAAGRVTVNGTVEGDLLAAAQTIVVEGTVGDDARVAGQALYFGDGARVAGDLVAAGFSLQTRPGTEVGGDVLLGAYQALLAGSIDGSVTAGAAGLALAGAIGGSVQADVGSPDDVEAAWAPATQVPVPPVEGGLTLTDEARVAGDLSYRSAAEASIAPGAEVTGEISYERVVVDDAEPAGPTGPLAVLLSGLRLFVTLLLAGLLALWLIPRTVTGAASVLRTRPLLSLGWGVLAIAGTAVAALAFLVVAILLGIGLGLLTLGGLAAAVVATGVVLHAVLVLGLILAIALLAPVVAGLTGGGLLLRDPSPARFGKRAGALALGLLIYVLLRAVPYLGPVVALLVALFGVGALAVWLWDVLRRRRAHRRGRVAGLPPGGTAGPGAGAGAYPQAGVTPYAQGGPGPYVQGGPGPYPQDGPGSYPQDGPGPHAPAGAGAYPPSGAQRPPAGGDVPPGGSTSARPPWAAGDRGPGPGPGADPDTRT
ncbi:polymer-forming cytoskeletal protein [Kocuria oceani]|uniref:Polymer-forming cytoskeletal protein n=1 Tax=Kocuria oceani TaxID=988827 RepID=A0ABV9TGU6_9MICC|nr:polymer-forming cytoskeletal protein [Kocuria oceani]